jgi:hypothetical protein
VESATFIRKLLDQGAFAVDQYSTSNEIVNGRSRRFRLGRRVLRPLHPSKNKPFAAELRFCYAGKFPSRPSIHGIHSNRAFSRSSENGQLNNSRINQNLPYLEERPARTVTYTVVNQLESAGQICIDNHPRDLVDQEEDYFSNSVAVSH